MLIVFNGTLKSFEDSSHVQKSIFQLLMIIFLFKLQNIKENDQRQGKFSLSLVETTYISFYSKRIN